MNYSTYYAPYNAQNRPAYGNQPYGGYNYIPQPPQTPSTPVNSPHTAMPVANQQVFPQIQDVRHGTEDEIKAHIVYPNCVAYFIDYPQNRLYAKSADASGISNIAYFSITPINADGTPVKPQEPTPQVNFDEFIKKEDLQNFGFVTIEQYDALAQKLEQIQKRLEGARTNVGQPKQPEARV